MSDNISCYHCSKLFEKECAGCDWSSFDESNWDKFIFVSEAYGGIEYFKKFLEYFPLSERVEWVLDCYKSRPGTSYEATPEEIEAFKAEYAKQVSLADTRSESMIDVEIRKLRGEIAASNAELRVAVINAGIAQQKVDMCRVAWEYERGNFESCMYSKQLNLMIAHDEIVAANKNLAVARAATFEAEALYEHQKVLYEQQKNLTQDV